MQRQRHALLQFPGKESTGADGQEDFASLVDLLTRLQAGEGAIPAVPEPAAAG